MSPQIYILAKVGFPQLVESGESKRLLPTLSLAQSLKMI